MPSYTVVHSGVRASIKSLAKRVRLAATHFLDSGAAEKYGLYPPVLSHRSIKRLMKRKAIRVVWTPGQPGASDIEVRREYLEPPKDGSIPPLVFKPIDLGPSVPSATLFYKDQGVHSVSQDFTDRNTLEYRIFHHRRTMTMGSSASADVTAASGSTTTTSTPASGSTSTPASGSGSTSTDDSSTTVEPGNDATPAGHFEQGTANTVFMDGKVPPEQGLLHRLDQEAYGWVLGVRDIRDYYILQNKRNQKMIQARYRMQCHPCAQLAHLLLRIHDDPTGTQPRTVTFGSGRIKLNVLVQPTSSSSSSSSSSSDSEAAEEKVAFTVASELNDYGRYVKVGKNMGLHAVISEFEVPVADLEAVATGESWNLSGRLQSGHRHQLRVHLSSIGIPITGDNLYSKNSEGRLELECTGYQLLQPEVAATGLLEGAKMEAEILESLDGEMGQMPTLVPLPSFGGWGRDGPTRLTPTGLTRKGGRPRNRRGKSSGKKHPAGSSGKKHPCEGACPPSSDGKCGAEQTTEARAGRCRGVANEGGASGAVNQ